MLGKFKDKVSGIQETIKQLTTEISLLEKKSAESHKIPELVLAEIKAVFAKWLAKIQSVEDYA